MAALYDAEELEAPTFQASGNGMTATRKIWIPDWDNISDYMKTMLGEYTVSGTTVTRTGPATFPGKSWLVLRTIDVGPMSTTRVCGSDVDAAAATCPEGAVCTLNYATMEWNLTGAGAGDDDDRNPQTYMTHKISGRLQMLTHAKDAVEWEFDDGAAKPSKEVPEDIKAAFQIPIIVHELEWMFIPDPPFSAIYGLLGSVNGVNANNPTGTWPTPSGFPRGTLLFADFTASRKQTTLGERHWQLSYTFLHKFITTNSWARRPVGQTQVPGWQDFLRPNSPGGLDWHRLVVKGTSNPLIGEANFDTLFIL